MRTFKQLKGMPVYLTTCESLCLLGSIEDLLFDQSGLIKGFKIDVKGFLQRDRFLPLTAPFLLEQEGLIIYSPNDLAPIDSNIKSYYSMKERNGIVGKPVVSEAGEQLGLVEDVYFREQLGTIEGIEMTEGWFTDITEGLKHIEPQNGLTVQNDILILKNT